MNNYIESELDGGRETLVFVERLKIPALIIFISTIILTIILFYMNIKVGYEPPNLIFFLLLIFIGIPSFIIAIISIRGFLLSGVWAVLWLGIGALTFGIATIISSFLIGRTDINLVITLGNLIILFASILYILGAFFTFNEVPVQEDSSRRLSTVLQIYISSIIIIIFIIIISVQGVLPAFFIQGSGGSPIRELVIAISAVFLFLSGIMILLQYLKSKSDLLYWYSLGLMMIALAVGVALITTVIGSPLNWTSRGAELIGGIFLIIAALVIFKTATAKNIPAEEAFASFFNMDKSNLEKLIQNVTDAIILYDNNFNIKGWNSTAEKVYGWKSKEMIGTRGMDYLRMYPFDINELSSTNEVIPEEGWHGEVIQKHKNGTDINILSSISPLKSENGLFEGIIIINRDITNQKQVESELLESKSILDYAQKIAHLGSWDWNAGTGNLRRSNEFFRILGIEPQIGQHKIFSFINYVHPDDRETVKKEMNKSFLEGKSHSFEARIVRPDGIIHQIYEKADVIERDVSGKPLRLIGTMQDITNHKLIEDQLEKSITELKRSNQELERFAYVSSHDLQEPLRMVTLYSQLLERRYKDSLDSDADDFIEYIVENAKRMK